MQSAPDRIMHTFILLILGGCFLLHGCAHDVRKATSPMDSADHHVFSGMKLIDQKRPQEAMREFRLAIELDPKYSLAYTGKALALGYMGEFHDAFKTMKHAKKYVDNRMQKAMAHVGYMRLYTMTKSKGWLDKVMDNYEDALDAQKDMPDVYYYMGIAFKQAYFFGKADREFKKVLELNLSYVSEADQQLKSVQEIQRAMPGTVVGKRLALQEMITRADMAAILVHELRLDRIYEKEGHALEEKSFIPRDIKDDPLRADIDTVINLGLRGLEVFPDGTFSPNTLLTRACYAMIVEDIISTIAHDPGLTIEFVGSPSPFPDVPSESPYFNAIMTCTTRGIMDVSDIRKGTFDPGAYVHGADALLIIRRLKEDLKIF